MLAKLATDAQAPLLKICSDLNQRPTSQEETSEKPGCLFTVEKIMRVETMIKAIKILFIFISLMLMVGTLAALPESPLNMDGEYTDWKSGPGGPAACFIDASGVDEANLNRVDITEYCLHVDPSDIGGLYLLMALDDTAPQNGKVRIVIDMNGDQIPDYSINNMLDSHPTRGLSIAGVSVSECGDDDCALNRLRTSCDNGGRTPCSGTIEGFNNDWPSQFTSSSCDGANCATEDGFIEMFVPWQWLGGSPPESYLFALYFSAHSGGTEDTSTDGSGGGLACDNNGCYVSGPSAISLQSFSAQAKSNASVWLAWPFLLLSLLSGVSLVSRGAKLKVFSRGG